MHRKNKAKVKLPRNMLNNGKEKGCECFVLREESINQVIVSGSTENGLKPDNKASVTVVAMLVEFFSFGMECLVIFKEQQQIGAGK